MGFYPDRGSDNIIMWLIIYSGPLLMSRRDRSGIVGIENGGRTFASQDHFFPIGQSYSYNFSYQKFVFSISPVEYPWAHREDELLPWLNPICGQQSSGPKLETKTIALGLNSRTWDWRNTISCGNRHDFMGYVWVIHSGWRKAQNTDILNSQRRMTVKKPETLFECGEYHIAEEKTI